MNLAEKLEKKLCGGKFRMLNEKLYVGKPLTKEEARKYTLYYAEQMSKWPQKPRQLIIDRIREAGPGARIADLGCGDAEIAAVFPNVMSYDKYPVNDGIVGADLEAIPAEDKAFDTAINCLSLMSTYVSRPVKEVNRILKIGGTWYVAEVQSRMSSVRTFIDGVEKFGFKLQEVDTGSNTHFCLMIFTKVSDCTITGRLPAIKLRPCMYKRR